MLNALKMDLYRMKKTKCAYIIALLCLAYLALNIWILSLSEQLSIQQKELSIEDVIVSMTSAETLTFWLVMFTAMFVNAEFNSGYIKNIMGDITDKKQYIIAKCITLTIYTAILMVIATVVAIFGGKVVLNSEMADDVSKILVYLVVKYLLNLAFVFIMLFVTLLVRNAAASTSIGVVYVLLAGGLLYALINLLVNKVFHPSDFNIARYLVYGNISLINNLSKTKEMIRAIVVAVIFGAASIFGGVQLMKRRDN